jgi:hypothetical protein
LWDVATGREIRTFSGHLAEVYSVAFSHDGRQILSGSKDNTIKLWDVATGREIRTFLGHSNDVRFVVFINDGRNIISGSYDGTIRVWDTATGREIVLFISFTDGEWIVITPEGYYNTSPNGDRYLNVRIGNNVYGIDQYRSTFYNPQIVEARLQSRSDPVRVTQNIQETALNEPPIIEIRNPQRGVSITTAQVQLSVLVTDQRQPIRSVSVLVNGKVVAGDAMQVRGGDLEIETTGIRFTNNQNRRELNLNITLEPWINRIEVVATNPYAEGRNGVNWKLL